MKNIVIIIPALNPGKNLLSYVAELTGRGFSRIILVDDGSREECKPIFTELVNQYGCDLLVHARNMGKGRALKDALNFYLNTYSREYGGVIAADADGQHKVADVVLVEEAMDEDRLILGVRDFSLPIVPFKSRFGNRITRAVMKCLIGGNITDTQTGLRGIPNKLCSEYLTLFGERFEYETTMLIESVRKQIPIREVTIETVYIDDNRETDFRPVMDSIAIFRLILGTFLKYITISLTSFALDYALFCLFFAILRDSADAMQVWTATVVARVLSSLFNYLMNRKVVFQSNYGIRRTLVRYYALCVVQMCCSALLVLCATQKLGWPSTTAKPFVDIALFFAGYQVQRKWVLKNKSMVMIQDQLCKDGIQRLPSTII